MTGPSSHGAARRLALALLASLATSACGPQSAPGTAAPAVVADAPAADASQREPAPPAEPTVRLPGDEEVLATVDGSEITRYELEAAIRAMLGETQAAIVDAPVRRRVLESLVTSRALARHQLTRMDEAGRAALDKRIAFHREQLLVNGYLEDEVSQASITETMIEDYHARHPDQFGDRPLAEVRAQVRERLEPVRLARAVEAVARATLDEAVVVYPEDAPGADEEARE